MVLLPAMMKDQITGVIETLLRTDPSFPHVVLALIAVIVLTFPLAVFFLLLGDLTRFYFHAHHVDGAVGAVFVPRFTLTGLRLADGELSASAAGELDAARSSDTAYELVVPQNARGRASIDQRLAAYGLRDDTTPASDADRAAGLFELVASKPRTLADEVAKVEYGMTRHLVRLQVIVMRYVKSLLVFLVTALAVFVAAAVVARDDRVGSNGQLWLAAVFAIWAPVMVVAVSSPVRWVEGLLRAEGAGVHSVSADQEFTKFERLSIAVSIVVVALASLVLAARLVEGADTTHEVVAGVILVASIVSVIVAARRSVAGSTRRTR